MLAFLLLAGSAFGGGDPLRAKQWGLEQVGAPAAWGTANGKGIIVAVVDSGVDLAHEDLASQILPGLDLVDGGTPQDADGHGTHVAGIAAAATDNDRGVAGIAYGARLLPVRVLDENGEGRSSDVATGIRWAADQGADVINLSLGDLGQPLFGPAFASAIRYAWSKGAICVVAAGNDYLLSSGYADEPAIVVSAVDRSGAKPAYSSGVGSARWGIAAPGGAGSILEPTEADVLSTYWSPGKTNQYGYLAGTSMAAPHVSGAAALLRSLGLSPQQTVDRLLATARDIGPSGRDSTFGSGLLDLAAAVKGQAPPASEKTKGGKKPPKPSGAGSPALPGSPAAPGPPTSASPVPTSSPSMPMTASPTPNSEAPPVVAAEPPPDATGGSSPLGPAAGALFIVVIALIGWLLFAPRSDP